jgi:hypothetical protein
MCALTNPTSPEHLSGEAGAFEAQRVNNFSIEIPLDGADKDCVIASLEQFKLPKMTNDKVELHYQNGVVYVAGKAKADDGSLVLKDMVDRDVLGAIMRWRNKVYSSKTGKIGFAANYKKTCHLVMTAPDNTLQRVCTLVGVFPVGDPDFNEFNMTSGDKMLLTVTLSCDKTDWAESIQGLV